MTAISPSAFAAAFIKNPGRYDHIVRAAVYVMRYGRQPWSEIMRMPVTLLMRIMRELTELIQKENQAGHMEDH